MKKSLILCLALALVLTLVPCSNAVAGDVTTVGDVDIELTGQLRARWQYYNNIYDFTDHSSQDSDSSYWEDGWCPSGYCDDDFAYMPIRFDLIAKVMLTRNVDVVADFQYVDYFGSGWGYDDEPWTDGYDSEWYWGQGGDDSGIDNPWGGEMDFYAHNMDGSGYWPAGAGYSRAYANVALFEAYIHIRNAWDSNWSLKLGRQKATLGSELLVGDDDWYDGLRFDGLRADWAHENVDLTLFWFKLNEGFSAGDVSDEDDGDFWGVYSDWKFHDKLGFDAYLFYLLDSHAGQTNFESWTPGVRFYSEESFGSGWNFDLELAYQMNTWQDMAWDDGPTDLDGNGWLFDGRVSYTFNHDYEPTLQFGFTYISGDDDLVDGEYDTDTDNDGFFRLFGESHNRWGNADLLYSSVLGSYNYDITSPLWGFSQGEINTATPGAMIFQLNYDMATAKEAIHWGANLLWFGTAVDSYTTPLVDSDGNWDDLDLDNFIAWEFDVWMSYAYSEHFSTRFNLSYISVGDFVADSFAAWSGDLDYDGDWSLDREHGYLQDNAWSAYANFLATW